MKPKGMSREERKRQQNEKILYGLQSLLTLQVSNLCELACGNCAFYNPNMCKYKVKYAYSKISLRTWRVKTNEVHLLSYSEVKQENEKLLREKAGYLYVETRIFL